MARKTIYGETLLIEGVIIGHCNLDQPVQFEGKGEFKYGVTSLISKSAKSQLNEIIRVIKEVADFDDIDEITKHPLIDEKRNLNDGDDKKHCEKEGFPGHYFFTARSKFPVELFSELNGEPIPCDAKDIYPGCEANIVIQAASYDDGCVNFYVKGVCKTGVGVRFKRAKPNIANMFGKAKSSKSTVSILKGHPHPEKEATVEPTRRKRKAAELEEVETNEAEEETEEVEEVVEQAPRRRGRRPSSGLNSLSEETPSKEVNGVAKAKAGSSEVVAIAPKKVVRNLSSILN